jgi:zinc transporter ZupT
MPVITMVVGSALILLGLLGYLSPEIIGTPPEGSRGTALIPAGFGLFLALLGLIASQGGTKRKHAMHGAAMISLLGVLGGLAMPIVKGIKGELNVDSAAFRSQILMAILSGFMLFMCIRSFVQARKAREAAAKAASV